MRTTQIALAIAVAGLVGCTASNPEVVNRKPPPTTTTTPVALPPVDLIINEVMADNESTVQDQNQQLADWVELLNVGDTTIDLTRISLWDKSENPWAPRDGTLEPGGRLLLWADGSTDEGHLPFRLSALGDTLSLAVDSEVIETLELPAAAEDVAYARHPDAGEWAFTIDATPGEPNNDLASVTLDPSDTVFVKDRYTIIDLHLTPAAYNTMNSRSKIEVPCEATIDGIYYPEISVRLKGSASFNFMDRKPAFKLDMNEYTPGQKFRGLKAFMLHNGNVFDPTRVHDYLTYRLAREAGIAAPRVGWILLTINGRDYGLYMNIETHDDVFIERHWPGQQYLGMLFEPDFDGSWDFGTGNGINFDYEEGPQGGDPDGRVSVQRLHDVVKLAPNDANVNEMWQVLDQDFLTYMAWETVVNHTDGYKSPNNWRFYVNSDTKKIHFVPSGAEWTWSTSPDIWWSNGQVANFCMNNAECKFAYAQEVLRVADLVETLDLSTEFEDITTWLAPEISADPRSPHSSGTINNSRNTTVRRLANNPNEVRQAVYATYPQLIP